MRFTREEVDERRAVVTMLAAERCNDHEIARRLGVSKTTVRNDRRLLGIAGHPPGQPPKSPLPGERRCETCGRVFRPRRENVKQGGGRFCSRACMARDEKRREASRRFVRSLNASRAQRIASLSAREEAAVELVPETEQTATALVRVGDLPAGTLVELVEDVPHSFGVVLHHHRNVGFVPVDFWDEPAALVPADAEVRILSRNGARPHDDGDDDVASTNDRCTVAGVAEGVPTPP